MSQSNPSFKMLFFAIFSADKDKRPNFDQIVRRLDDMMITEKGGGIRRKVSSLIDRHSTWF